MTSKSPTHPVNIPIYNLYLNDCTFLEILSGSVVAALLVISRKINIFTSVQRVIALFYKRSCFVCFQLDPVENKTTIILNLSLAQNKHIVTQIGL